jgi:hypothetical protein
MPEALNFSPAALNRLDKHRFGEHALAVKFGRRDTASHRSDPSRDRQVPNDVHACLIAHTTAITRFAASDEVVLEIDVAMG